VALTSNLAINHTNTGYNAVLDGIVSGAGSITQNGTGRVYISKANTFTGGYTLNGGTAAILNVAGFGNGTLTFNAGTFEPNGGMTLVNSINLGGNVTRTGTSGTVTFSGPVTLTANSHLTLNQRLDISGGISGGFSLTKDGVGIMNFYSAAKTYNGGFTLNSGPVLAQVSSAFGTGTLRLNGGSVSVGTSAL